MLNELGSTVMGWVLMITGSASFITVVGLAIKIYSLIKKNKKIEINSSVKDEQIKATENKYNEILIAFSHLANVVNAMALNSGVSVETKQYIATQNEELRKMFPKVSKAKELIETEGANILEEAKVLSDNVKKTTTEHIEKANEIKQDVLDVYSKIISNGE